MPRNAQSSRIEQSVIDVSTMTGDNKKNQSRCTISCALLGKGATQTVLRRTPPGNGPEAWRQPHLRYGQKDMMYQCMSCSARLHFSVSRWQFAGCRCQTDQFEAWNHEVQGRTSNVDYSERFDQDKLCWPGAARNHSKHTCR